MHGDSVKNLSAYADQNHAPSLADARLEVAKKETTLVMSMASLPISSFYYKHRMYYISSVLLSVSGYASGSGSGSVTSMGSYFRIYSSESGEKE